MIADWSTLNKFTTPRGDLILNAATGDRYLTLNERCDAGADIRTTFDNIPQSDGQLNHRQYLTGYKMRLALALWADAGGASAPACGVDAQRMLDALGSQIDAIRNPSGTTRIIWTPQTYPSRMVNEIVLMEKPVVTVEPVGEEGIVTVTFGVVSPLPYEISEAEDTPGTLPNGAPELLQNLGNTDTWPVFRVAGPTSSFSIVNSTTGLEINYTGTAIGALHYAEIDTFRGTVYLDGNSSNLLNGIDFLTTDFFPLVPGTNDVVITGADATVLYNDAWL